MIDSLHLQNFQGHADSLLEFSPGINAIIGKSDNGKSSIVRALNYARYNRPASNNYPSHWLKNSKGNLIGEMSVTIRKGTDSISRYKNKDENGYKINGEILKAINKDVPEQVESLFNLSEVNIQKQLDSHFLLADTPGQVAQFFNELVNLEEIDLYLSECASIKLKNNKEIKDLTELAEKQNAELLTFAHIEKAEKLNKSLAIVESEIDTLEKEINSITLQLNSHKNLAEILDNFPDIDKGFSLISEIENLPPDNSAEIKRIESSLTAYYTIGNELADMPDIAQAEKLISEIAALPEIDESEIENIEIELRQYASIIKMLDKLSGIDEAEGLISKIEKYNSKINDSNTAISQLEKEIHAYNNYCHMELMILEDIAELESQLPDTCPLCGNALSEGGLKCLPPNIG